MQIRVATLASIVTAGFAPAMACSTNDDGDNGGTGGGTGGGGGTSGTSSGGDGTGGTGTGGAGTGSSSGGTGGGGTEGIPPGDNCQTVEDCVLDNDCCHCTVYQDALPENHGCSEESCDQPRCDELGVLEALCLNGNCVLSKVDCDPGNTACDGLPPDCSDGDVPSVADDCWTGICIDPAHCEQATYFGCDECGAEEACVDFSWCEGDSCTGVTTCWPHPAGCGDVLDCACGTEALCAQWGYQCFESGARTYCCGGDIATCEIAG